MIKDFDTMEAEPPRAAVVIIGAGAVGLVLAVALARAGIEVILLESGGSTLELTAQKLNDSRASGRPHRGISEGRARILGGTTTLWGGQLIAFRDVDFAARPWLGLERWPIMRDELEPFYQQAAHLLGLAITDDEDSGIWAKIGLVRPDMGEDFTMILTRWLRETNLARYFAADLKTLPTLTTLLHATVTDMELAWDGKTISAVRVRSPSGRTATIGADTIVVASGTIEASRLMLVAAHNNPAVPWAANENVGEGFQDHLDLRAATVELLDKKRFGQAFDNIFLRGFKYNPKVVLSKAVQEAHGLTNVAGGFIFESSLSDHISNIKIFVRAMRNGAVPPNIRSLPKHVTALAKVWWPIVTRYLKDHRAFNPADLGIHLNIHCEQVPLRESRIRLVEDVVDSNGMPIVDLDWRVDGREVDTMACFATLLGKQLEQLGLARLHINPLLVARDPEILALAGDTNHHCSGLRMSTNAATGVVDADLRVHGTNNLYVTGASVFPSSSFANPTYTAIALTLRLAARLGGTHGAA